MNRLMHVQSIDNNGDPVGALGTRTRHGPGMAIDVVHSTVRYATYAVRVPYAARTAAKIPVVYTGTRTGTGNCPCEIPS